jgi:hypothetical protein
MAAGDLPLKKHCGYDAAVPLIIKTLLRNHQVVMNRPYRFYRPYRPYRI